MTPSAATQPQQQAHAALESHAVPTVDSQALFEGHRELLIQHHGECYRLRITRQGKLILTK